MKNEKTRAILMLNEEIHPFENKRGGYMKKWAKYMNAEKNNPKHKQ